MRLLTMDVYFAAVFLFMQNSYCYENKQLRMQSLKECVKCPEAKTGFLTVRTQPFPYHNENYKFEMIPLPHKRSLGQKITQNQLHSTQKRLRRNSILRSGAGFLWNNLRGSNSNDNNARAKFSRSFESEESNDRLIFDDEYSSLKSINTNWPITTSIKNPASFQPVSTVEITTTTAPCENCQTTSEYNPICGTDGITYFNRARLRCVQRCGKSKYLCTIGPSHIFLFYYPKEYILFNTNIKAVIVNCFYFDSHLNLRSLTRTKHLK